MGDSVCIVAAFSCSDTVVAPGFGFGIEDVEGRRILSFNNYMMPSPEVGHDVRQGVVRCHIPRLTLLTGTYFVTLSLTRNRREYIDKVGRALKFNVESADVYGSGVIPIKNQGFVFTDFSISYTQKLTLDRAGEELFNDDILT
jgi:hypothetical protein